MFVSTWTPRTGDSGVVGLCAVVIDPRASGTLEARMPVVVRVPSFFIRWMGRHHTMCRNCAAPLYHMRWRTCSSCASSRKFSSTSRCNLRSRTGVDVPDPCTGRKVRVMARHTLSLCAAGCGPLEMCRTQLVCDAGTSRTMQSLSVWSGQFAYSALHPSVDLSATRRRDTSQHFLTLERTLQCHGRYVYSY